MSLNGTSLENTLVSTGNVQLDERIKFWLDLDKNPQTRKEVINLVKGRKIDDLKSRMFGGLSFGTAGIRAEMAAGFKRLNDLVIIQVAQGVCQYLLKVCGVSAKERGVVIGFDARHNSSRFASLSANVLALKGIKVYLFSDIVSTPMVSFAVTLLNCQAGIMVTASHNPAKDNGYKVYWNNGAQIIAPHDTGIIAVQQENLEPWPDAWKLEKLKGNPLVCDPYDRVLRAYVEASVKHYCYEKSANQRCPIKFTYSPFHGVGARFTPGLMEAFGFPKQNLIPVKEQWEPDPDFPTVKFPNPEEGKHVLKLSIDTAEANSSLVILCSDPDADRFQCAEKQPDGRWHIFTGNEMGGLIAWWLWEGFLKHNPGKTGKDVYMINSTVSSKLMKTIAKAEGFNYEETLTGFKWMGNRAFELKKQGKTVLLAWEESIGYCFCEQGLDKDGVIAAAVFAEMANHLYNQSLNLAVQLDNLYKKYGYHLNAGSYFICTDPAVTNAIFERIRNYNPSGSKYPETCAGCKVVGVRDLTTGFDSSTPDKKPLLPASKSSQMITFTLEDSSTVTVRASGTEPKLKYYIEVQTKPGCSLKNAEALLAAFKDHVTVQWIQPQVHNLVAKEE